MIAKHLLHPSLRRSKVGQGAFWSVGLPRPQNLWLQPGGIVAASSQPMAGRRPGLWGPGTSHRKNWGTHFSKVI